MIQKILRRLERFLRDHQDPRYRNAPWILPQRAWRGSGNGPLTAEQLAQFNVKDMGFDPAVVSKQPINRMLKAITRGAQNQSSSERAPTI